MDAHLPDHENAESARFRAAGPSPSNLRSGHILVGPLRALTDASALDEADRQRVRDLYDGQIRFVDQEIGGLIAWLRSERLLRDTVILLTADHGEELWEHGNVEHGHSLYDEVVRVPLIVFGPGIPPGRVDAPVSLVDVAPTLERLAGLDPAPGDGRDLLAAPAEPGRSLRLTGTLYGPEKHALVRGSTKAIATSGNHTMRRHLVGPRSFAPRELYDLASDPGERRPLGDGDGGPQAAALRAELDGFAGEPAPASARAALVDDETRERLRALGYGQ
jgi:arylsulfatase A-like enzyme